MSKHKRAVYAGTFDPITKGHIDIARRGAALFDEVIVAVAEDNYKRNLFTTEERCALASEALADADNITVIPFRGLLMDFCREHDASFIIRGLRAVSDFDLEFQMALLNRSLSEDVDSVFLMSAEKYLYISSSIIRNTVAAGGDVSHLVPECVYKAMMAKKGLLRR